MEIKWIEYKGKKILYVDYRGAKNEDDMLKVLHELADTLKNCDDNDVLSIGNFKDTFVSQKFMDEIKRLGKEIITKKTKKGAILGIEGIKKILYKTYLVFTGEKNMSLFDSEEEAKEWLVS